MKKYDQNDRGVVTKLKFNNKFLQESGFEHNYEDSGLSLSQCYKALKDVIVFKNILSYIQFFSNKGEESIKRRIR